MSKMRNALMQREAASETENVIGDQQRVKIQNLAMSEGMESVGRRVYCVSFQSAAGIHYQCPPWNEMLLRTSQNFL